MAGTPCRSCPCVSATRFSGVAAVALRAVQVISFMAWLIEQGVYHPMIVVCPLSVVGNWCTEIKRFAPSLDTTRCAVPLLALVLCCGNVLHVLGPRPPLLPSRRHRPRRYLGKREEREAMRLNKKAFPPECKRGTGECKAPMPILVTSYQVGGGVTHLGRWRSLA